MQHNHRLTDWLLVRQRINTVLLQANKPTNRMQHDCCMMHIFLHKQSTAKEEEKVHHTITQIEGNIFSNTHSHTHSDISKQQMPYKLTTFLPTNDISYTLAHIHLHTHTPQDYSNMWKQVLFSCLQTEQMNGCVENVLRLKAKQRVL